MGRGVSRCAIGIVPIDRTSLGSEDGLLTLKTEFNTAAGKDEVRNFRVFFLQNKPGVYIFLLLCVF